MQSQRDDLDRRAREIERATQEAERYRTQVASLEAATKKLGGTLAAVTSERDRLRGELDAARQSESTAAKQAEERRQRIAELDRLLAQSKQELATSASSQPPARRSDERRRIEQDVAKWQAEIERQASEIKRAEEDARRYRAQVEELERRMAASTPDEKPVIRIIDPPYVATRDSGVIKIQTNLDKRDVVGQVFARSAVVSLTINDKAYPIAKDGMFKASIPVSTMMTPVTVVAVDARGNRSAVEFSLRRPMDAVALGVNFGTFHALVIGNQKYEKLPSLQTSAEDARAVCRRAGEALRLQGDAAREREPVCHPERAQSLARGSDRKGQPAHLLCRPRRGRSREERELAAGGCGAGQRCELDSEHEPERVSQHHQGETHPGRVRFVLLGHDVSGPRHRDASEGRRARGMDQGGGAEAFAAGALVRRQRAGARRRAATIPRSRACS